MKRKVGMRFLSLCAVLLCALFVTGTTAEYGETEPRIEPVTMLSRPSAVESKAIEIAAPQPSAPSAEPETAALGNTLYAKPIGELSDGCGEEVDASRLSAEQMGKAVVEAALTKSGCPYVWGAKGDDEFDCSGLVYWAIREVDPQLGQIMYANASTQAKYCFDNDLTIDPSELRPGDLVFWDSKVCPGCCRWQEIHHVAIYVGDGQIIEASNELGCVCVRDIYEEWDAKIVLYGRPYG